MVSTLPPLLPFPAYKPLYNASSCVCCTYRIFFQERWSSPLLVRLFLDSSPLSPPTESARSSYRRKLYIDGHNLKLDPIPLSVYQPNNTLFMNYKKTFVRVQDVNNMFLGRQPSTFHCNLFSFINSFIEWSNLQLLPQTNCSLKSQVCFVSTENFPASFVDRPFFKFEVKKVLNLDRWPILLVFPAIF